MTRLEGETAVVTGSTRDPDHRRGLGLVWISLSPWR